MISDQFAPCNGYTYSLLDSKVSQALSALSSCLSRVPSRFFGELSDADSAIAEELLHVGVHSFCHVN